MKILLQITAILLSVHALKAQGAAAVAMPAASCKSPATAKRFEGMSQLEFTDALNGFSSSVQTDDLSRAMIKANKRGEDFNTVPGMKCYRAVKVGLTKSWTTQYLPGLAAKNAGLALELIGFVNLLCHYNQAGYFQSPYDAPHGAILVYDGGPYGHIEVRVNNGDVNGFFSDYFCATARTGKRENGRTGRPTPEECDPVLSKEDRTLIGIYIKL